MRRMGRKNPRALAERVIEAAEASLARAHMVSPLDVFLRIGWVQDSTIQRWRQGQIDCLEGAMQTSAARIAEALTVLESWASGRGLRPRVTDYIARTPRREALHFGRSREARLEERYRTHWISPELTEKQQSRIAAKASLPPELVVIRLLNDEWKCHRCGGSGDFLIMQNEGPSCLACAGLGDLEYLPAGDALLTRRAKAASARGAVVVRFSRTRGRYERLGLLVEPQALADAEREAASRRK